MRVSSVVGRFTAFVVGLAILVGVVTCDANPSLETEDRAATDVSSATERAFPEEWGLTSEQTAEVQEALQEAGRGTPGALWHVASALHAQMSPDEVASFLSRPLIERRNRRSGRVERGGGRGRGGREEGARKKAWRGSAFPGVAEEVLTEEQQAQIQELRQQRRAEMARLRDEIDRERLSVEEARARREDLRADMRAEIERLLTAEQKAELELKRQNRTETRERRREEGLETAAEVLDLSEEEVARFDEIMSAARAARRATLESAASDGKSAEDVKSALDQIRETRTTDLNTLLGGNRVEIVMIHDRLRRLLADHRYGNRFSGVTSGKRDREVPNRTHRRRRSEP
jgi:Spy/CpxP family protein refolding chaperone